MELVLRHGRRDLRDVDDLMAVGVRVIAFQGAAATTARIRLEHLGARDLLGRYQRPRLLVVTGLPAALSTRSLRWCWRWRAGRVRRGRARRVAGELGQLGFQIPDSLLESD